MHKSLLSCFPAQSRASSQDEDSDKEPLFPPRMSQIIKSEDEMRGQRVPFASAGGGESPGTRGNSFQPSICQQGRTEGSLAGRQMSNAIPRNVIIMRLSHEDRRAVPSEVVLASHNTENELLNGANTALVFGCHPGSTATLEGKRSRTASREHSRDRRHRRGPFKNKQHREETALTRAINACVRCRRQKIRCVPGTNYEGSACGPCLALTDPTRSRLCFRYPAWDVSLFREQPGPNPAWTKRWDRMELHDITDWAAGESRTIQVTHLFRGTSFAYSLHVAMFNPAEGDMLEEAWADGGIMKKHSIPPYEITNMEEATESIRTYVDRGVFHFMLKILDTAGDLIWYTYSMAFTEISSAKTSEEKTLLAMTFRLWVTARMTSNPERICGGETFGSPVIDPSSPFYDTYPIPPVMCAQLEIITFSKMLRPFRQAIIEGLSRLFEANNPQYWFTIYLVLFILLHSCSLTTKRNEEYAQQMMMETKYANPESIRDHHIGARILLTHFHCNRKGAAPFAKAADPSKYSELKEAAGLSSDQLKFLIATVTDIRHKQREIKQIRAKKDFGHNLYFVSQLFDDAWVPLPSAE